MPQQLTLTLLDTPRATLNDVVIAEFRSSKTQALLYYLAVTGRSHTRVALAGLLWGGHTDKQARVNLSKSLSNLRSLVGDHLIIERQTVEFNRKNYALDVDMFWDAYSTEAQSAVVEVNSASSDLGAIAGAVDLYQGEFLDGFYVDDAPEFEQWVQTERLRLRERLLKMLLTLSDGYVAHSDFHTAIEYTQRILQVEPWREEAHQRMMLLLAHNGQRSAALAHFELCKQALEEELGVEPDEATIALLQHIRDGGVEATSTLQDLFERVSVNGRQTNEDANKDTLANEVTVSIDARSEATAPRHNLPTPSTPFVGRSDEVALLVDNLLNPSCRLLTLIGQGGIGKTRLALQVAQTIVQQKTLAFTDGVLFVPLESVSASSGLLAAIAQAANFSFYADLPLEQQLLNYLCEKQILFVLDNFEHLLDEILFIADVLTAAPHIKVLVTSREMINLQEAWFYPVSGLAYPVASDESNIDTADSDAIQLFVQCAERTGGPLAAVAIRDELPSSVAQICRLVDGVPLGIELAASWMRVMPVDEIAQELAQNLDILTARYKNVPERHRSMRAVLEHSWQLLNEEEQTVLQRFAIFRGSADRAAIHAITGSSLLVLAALVEKTLLTMEQSGRYRLHELTRQFLQEKLEQDPQEVEQIRHRHYAYYLPYMGERMVALGSRGQRGTLDDIEQELDNIRGAWLTACQDGQTEMLFQSARGLYRFYRIRSRYQEAKDLFAQTVLLLDQAEDLGQPNLFVQLQCQANIFLGAFEFYLGDYDHAANSLQRGLTIAERQQHVEEEARAYNFLGQIAGQRGEKDEARAQLQKSLARYTEADDQSGMADVLHKLAQVDGGTGKYVAQKACAQESLTISRKLGRPDWIASALDVLGWATLCLGEYAESEACYRKSLSLSQEIGSQFGTALALGGIGSVAWVAGGARLQEARDYFLRSLALCREAGHRHHISDRLWYLGQVASDMGDYPLAKDYAEEGLMVARSIGSQIFAAYNLSCLGEVAVATGNFADGRDYLLEALQLALDAHHLPPLAMALIQFSRLRMQEIEESQPDALQGKEQVETVLQWLQLISDHTGCWLVFRQRAEKLRAEIVTGQSPISARPLDNPKVDAALEEAVLHILTEEFA